VRSKHCPLWITVGNNSSRPWLSDCSVSRAASMVCCQAGLRALSPGFSDQSIFSAYFLPPSGWFTAGQCLTVLRPASIIPVSLCSPPPVQNSVLCLCLPFSDTDLDTCCSWVHRLESLWCEKKSARPSGHKAYWGQQQLLIRKYQKPLKWMQLWGWQHTHDWPNPQPTYSTNHYSMKKGTTIDLRCDTLHPPAPMDSNIRGPRNFPNSLSLSSFLLILFPIILILSLFHFI
jgi:hypothetical protein